MPFSLAVELWGRDKEDSDDDDTCFDLFNPTSTGLQVKEKINFTTHLFIDGMS